MPRHDSLACLKGYYDRSSQDSWPRTHSLSLSPSPSLSLSLFLSLCLCCPSHIHALSLLSISLSILLILLFTLLSLCHCLCLPLTYHKHTSVLFITFSFSFLSISLSLFLPHSLSSSPSRTCPLQLSTQSNLEAPRRGLSACSRDQIFCSPLAVSSSTLRKRKQNQDAASPKNADRAKEKGRSTAPRSIIMALTKEIKKKNSLFFH